MKLIFERSRPGRGNDLLPSLDVPAAHKEREEKEKLRQDQKKLMKEAIIKEIRREDTKAKDGKEKDADANANKKKRLRINNNKEKVDINNASNFQRGGDNRGGGGKGPHAGGGQQGAGGGNNHQGGKIGRASCRERV